MSRMAQMDAGESPVENVATSQGATSVRQLPRLDCMLELPLVPDAARYSEEVEENEDEHEEGEEQEEANEEGLCLATQRCGTHHKTLRASTRSAVQEVIDVARAANCFPLCALAPDSTHPTTRPGQSVEVKDVPRDTGAILVICAARSSTQALPMISAYAAMRGRPPIIAVLIREEQGNTYVDTVVQAQLQLSEAGADDVVMQGSTQEELRCAIAMGIVRAKEWQTCEDERHRHIRQIQELQTGIWRTVANYCPEFPRMVSTGPKTLRAGTQVGECRFAKLLGFGITSDVWSAWNSGSRRKEAVKAIRKDRIRSVEEAEGTLTEARLLPKLKHKNIPSLYGFIHTPNFLFIHMEFSGPQNLFQAIAKAGGQLSEKSAKVLSVQIVAAVEHCHQRRVAHCDIKPENIVLEATDGGVLAKLVDFGSAVEITAGSTLTGFRGTMPFMAPEVLSGRAFEPAATDIWSTGLVTLEMLCGTNKLNRMMEWDNVRPHPRLQQELIRVFQQPQVLKQALESDRVASSPDLVSMLEGVLRVFPRTRWSAQQLAGCPWLSTTVGQPGLP
jgi:hypothetical protein